jgi:pimeloyl-ACP methyl ester carboxylesterase
MMTSVEVTLDVTAAAGIGTEAYTVATIVLPDVEKRSERTVVCFGLPGAGYSRAYYTFDMPGSSVGGEAGWHVDRGWVFVACDCLGVGEATCPDTPEDPVLTYDVMARANRETVDQVMCRLRDGSVDPGFPPIRDPVVLGVGQSMGGGFTIAMQGQYRVYDGVGILGFSAFHTQPPTRPGMPPLALPWSTRSGDLREPLVLNAEALARGTQELMGARNGGGEHPLAYAFHYDDVPSEIVSADLAAYDGGPLQGWRSATTPACVGLGATPGVVATEAAAITVPVLLAMGERDVVPDPLLEPKAFRSATDISVFVCPQMGHMHNFATTREVFWQRIHSWGEMVALARPQTATGVHHVDRF